MEEEKKDKLKELEEKIAQLQSEVAAMAKEAPESEPEVVVAPPAEAEAKPEKQYEVLFGDRRREVKKPGKYSLLIFILVAAAVLVYGFITMATR